MRFVAVSSAFVAGLGVSVVWPLVFSGCYGFCTFDSLKAIPPGTFEITDGDRDLAGVIVVTDRRVTVDAVDPTGETFLATYARRRD